MNFGTKYLIHVNHAGLLEGLRNRLGEPAITITHSPLNKHPNIFDYRDVVFANYPGVDWSKVEPVDGELLKKMGDCERIYLKMADRLTPGSSYQQRKDEYIKHLRFWHWKLSGYPLVQLAIFENIPHEGYDFVLYSLLKMLNIPVFSLYSMPARPYKVVLRYVVTDIFDHGQEVRKTYKNLCNNESAINLTVDDLSPALRFFLEEHETNEKKIKSFAIPIQVKTSKKVLSYLNKTFARVARMDFLTIIKSAVFLIKSNKLIDEWLFRFKNRNPYFETEAQVAKYYHRHSVDVSLTVPYVYFPLHYQPEASTSPLGEDYVDQALVCELLSWVAGPNVMIYVKEHPRPSRAFCTRNIAFYDRLLGCKNVVFVSKHMDTYNLIDRSLAVATVTGTAGWEAFLRRKPVLMFGSKIYDTAPNVFRIKSKDDLRVAFRKICTGDLDRDRQSVLRYLKAIDSHVFEAYCGDRQKLYAPIDELTNIKNICDQIEKYTSKIVH